MQQSDIQRRTGVRRLSATTFSLLVLTVIIGTGCSPLTLTIGGEPHGIDTTRVLKEDGWTTNKVALVDIDGMIVNGHRGGLLSRGEHPVSLLHEKLEAAARDDSIKAVILRINSPGGTVTASDAMYREVLRFKERSKKPVVTLMMDVAASGGYYTACATDHIVAYPSTITGSIGVILQTMSVKPMLDKIGVSADAITSGPNKAAGSPFEALSDEHRAIMQGLVDDFYGRFVTVVKKGRPNIPPASFKMVTDGRIFTGSQAVSLGLVDELGDVYDAWRRAKLLAGIERAHLVRFHRPLSQPASPYAAAPLSSPRGTQVNLMQLNLSGNFPLNQMGFYYMWQPKLMKP